MSKEPTTHRAIDFCGHDSFQTVTMLTLKDKLGGGSATGRLEGHAPRSQTVRGTVWFAGRSRGGSPGPRPSGGHSVARQRVWPESRKAERQVFAGAKIASGNETHLNKRRFKRQQNATLFKGLFGYKAHSLKAGLCILRKRGQNDPKTGG